MREDSSLRKNRNNVFDITGRVTALSSLTTPSENVVCRADLQTSRSRRASPVSAFSYSGNPYRTTFFEQNSTAAGWNNVKFVWRCSLHRSQRWRMISLQLKTV